MVVFFKYRGQNGIVEIYVELRKVGGNFQCKFVAGWHIVALGVVRSRWVDCSDFNNFLLRHRFQSVTARGHFDEAVEDDEEFREMGGNNSANDIFLTLATDFRTEAPALEHLCLNLALPNLVVPVLSSL